MFDCTLGAVISCWSRLVRERRVVGLPFRQVWFSWQKFDAALRDVSRVVTSV
ncbi:MAG: hypothetical protein ACK5ZG_02170 [Phycisphaerae bacterium]|jgi:hypothetical protein